MRYFATVFDTLLWLRARATMRDRVAAPVGRDLGQQRSLDAALGADAQRVELTASDVAGNQEFDNAIEKLLARFDQHVLGGAEL